MNARGPQQPGGGKDDVAWTRRRDALAKTPGVATVTRELPGDRTLSLAYVRTGPRASTPVLVLPGGPGLASVMPYQRFRAAAATHGLDVLMVEHRGVGISRKTTDGIDLRPEEITIRDTLADLVAVLDAVGLERVIVYGSSYGSYLAGAFGALHPDRVSAMILDSPLLDGRSTQETSRELNRLYWHGTDATSAQAARVRELLESGAITAGEAGFPLQLLHESGGPELVSRMLNLLARGRGRRVWSWLTRLGAADVMNVRPFLMEFDLVARSAFTELGYGLPHDETLGPLRSDAPFADLADRYPTFMSEPVDVRNALSHVHWPIQVLSGDRDIRTPRTVAEQLVSATRHATLVPIGEHGHSALDTAPSLAIAAMCRQVGARGTVLHPTAFTARRSLIARLISSRLALAAFLPSVAS